MSAGALGCQWQYYCFVALAVAEPPGCAMQTCAAALAIVYCNASSAATQVKHVPRFSPACPAVSAMYYLLSSFGRPFLEQQPAAGAAAATAAGDALLLALQGQALVREAMASAAVALYAAAALPAARPAALARCFAQGLLVGSGSGAAGGGAAPLLLLAEEADGSASKAAAAVGSGAVGPAIGLVDAHLRQRQARPDSAVTSGSSHDSGQSGLAEELSRLPPLNRICAIRGLLAAMPAAVACAPLVARWPGQAGQAGQREEQPWLLLVDGALPAISEAIQASLGIVDWAQRGYRCV